MSDATLSPITPLKTQNIENEELSKSYVGQGKLSLNMTIDERETFDSPIAVYLRVSTDEQNVDSQFLFVDGLVRQHGLDPNNVRVFKDEGISATKMGNLSERPQGKKLIEAIEKGEISHVFAFRVDRMFRDLEAGASFIKWITNSHSNVAVITTDAPVPLNTADGEFLFGMQVLLARREAAVLSVRTTGGMDAKRESLKPTSHAVFGWNICHTTDGEKTMRPNWKEQDVIDWVHVESKNGKSYSAIARQLNDWGVKTKTGRNFNSGTTNRMVNQAPKQQDMLHLFERPKRISKPPFRTLSTTQK